MNPFQSMTYKGCANPKQSKERYYGEGKCLYDVFYKEGMEGMTGSVRGDNQKHAKENFIVLYGDLKIIHFQRYPENW